MYPSCPPTFLMVICALHAPRWLCNDQIDAGTRRWAVEGLAYLTFDADVKEEFVEDEAALKALFQLSKVAPWVPAVVRGHCLGLELTGLSWQVLANGFCDPTERWAGSPSGRSV